MIYTRDLIPKSPSRRPGKPLKATIITVHNTANPTSTSKQERLWLVNPRNKRTASWHLVVDEKEVIEAIPLNEVAWHAGALANTQSIGIEICESGCWETTKANAAKLIADLLKSRGWGIDRVKQHRHWTGKNCPRKLIPEWEDFLKEIESYANK